MRRYEMLILITDELDEDAAKEVVDRARSTITDQDGEVLDEAWWGKRKLAYEIKHRSYGWYHVFDFRSTEEARAEVERQLKISDHVVRFKTLRPELHVHRAKASA